jgi:peptidoglycan-associated lipoprotein
MNMKIMGAFSAVALLAACAEPASTASTGGTGAATAQPVGIIPGSQEDLVTNVGDRVLFGFDKSNLTPESRAVLDRQAAWLGKFSTNAVQVAGNTDERGTEEWNIALGQRRANAARDYLVAKGVASARITTISFGKDRPVDPASNEAAWAKNRNAITSVK